MPSGHPTRYYAIVAGSHPTLPHAELRGILDAEAAYWRILAVHTQLVVFEAEGVEATRITGRAGFVEEVGRLLAYTEAEPRKIIEALEGLEPQPGTYRVELRRLRGFAADMYRDKLHILREFISVLESRGWRLSPRGGRTLRIVIDEGVAVIGVMEARLRVSELRGRWPHLRPFYKPGALDPRMARLFVNLARARRGSVFLDPFCGTGGFVIEALLSVKVREAYCGDVDEDMAGGSRANLSFYAPGGFWHTLRWDARRLPLRNDTIDSIGTDSPYGRMTTTRGLGVEAVVRGAIEEAGRVLRRGSYLAIACPHWVDCPGLIEEHGLRLREVHYMRVHGSLTRVIIVAVR